MDRVAELCADEGAGCATDGAGERAGRLRGEVESERVELELVELGRVDEQRVDEQRNYF